MVDWLKAESAGNYFFYAFPAVLILLFVLLKTRRGSFLAPCAILTLVIVNPWFYRKWESLGLYAYWRLLWIVPVVPVLAMLVPAIAEKAGMNRGMKAVVAAAGAILVALGGTFLYHGAGGGFTLPSPNRVKLPADVVAVSDYLLTLDEAPKVVAQEPLGVYMRQYSGKIDSMLGRDIYGYILAASEEAHSVNDQLGEPQGDMALVATVMAEKGYEYLVVDDAERKEKLEDAGFRLIDHIVGYGIYRAPNTQN